VKENASKDEVAKMKATIEERAGRSRQGTAFSERLAPGGGRFRPPPLYEETKTLKNGTNGIGERAYC
jgi:hypothetical protein